MPYAGVLCTTPTIIVIPEIKTVVYDCNGNNN
jgi:hypothetical protein